MGKYLDMTGLSHLIVKMKGAFAALVHTHSASDITSGTLSESYGGTGHSSFDDAMISWGDTKLNDYGPLIFTDQDEWETDHLAVKYGGTGATNAAGARTNLGAQATLVSGTNIKTVNNTSLLGSGNVAVQPTLVSGTNIKTVNSTSLLGSGNVAVQPTLVSGTNIKTINNQSILGSGNISISGGGSIDFGAELDAECMSRAEDYGDFGAVWFDEDETLHVGGKLPAAYAPDNRVSATVTPTSASGSMTAYANNGIATVRGYNVAVSSALASGSTVTIGTLNASYRPALAMYATCASANATACGRIMVTVNANGNIQLTNRSGSSLATTSALYFTVTYVI